MHWLTWREFVQFVRSWQGATAAAIAVSAAIYYGPRKVLETWDWYIERFRDAPVHDVLRNRKLHYWGARSNFSAPQVLEEEYGIDEIAAMLNRNRRSVAKSLHRLRRQGRCSIHKGGWVIKE